MPILFSKFKLVWKRNETCNMQGSELCAELKRGASNRKKKYLKSNFKKEQPKSKILKGVVSMWGHGSCHHLYRGIQDCGILKVTWKLGETVCNFM